MKPFKENGRAESTSWNEVSEWYHGLVGERGHYYHRHVILPQLIPLLELQEARALLDVGCGQGVLARHLPEHMDYHGIDVAPGLIAKAPKGPRWSYTVADICLSLPPFSRRYDRATMVLSLQNMEHPKQALEHMGVGLEPGAIAVLVLNHPCFRIPRQTHWGIDEQNHLRYRRINRYLSPLRIPINSSPGGQGPTTFSFHHSLTDYSQFLHAAGFTIELIQEWISDKVSEGTYARQENLARSEFPLFLALKCRKI